MNLEHKLLHKKFENFIYQRKWVDERHIKEIKEFLSDGYTFETITTYKLERGFRYNITLVHPSRIDAHFEGIFYSIFSRKDAKEIENLK